MTTSTTSIVSIGKACELLQAGINRIRVAAAELGIKPALTINLVDHFNEDDLDRIRARLNSQNDEHIRRPELPGRERDE